MSNNPNYPGYAFSSTLSHKPLEKNIVTLAPGVYGFIGYSTSNFGVIASKNGYVLIDTGDKLAGCREAREEIRKLAPGPLQGIVLTHSHFDHCTGADAFLADAAPDIPIWGQRGFNCEAKDGEGINGILGKRANRHFGGKIPYADYPVNSLVPHFPDNSSGKPVAPNQFVDADTVLADIDGVRLALTPLPSETRDHLAVWLADKKTLFAGDAIYGAFPNLSPLRGAAYRDVERWAKSVRQLLEYDAQALLCGHVLAFSGPEIKHNLEVYAEAIEYVYRETLRGINAGKTPDDLAAEIQLPDHLRQEPILGEFYGAIPWGVRSIFAAKVGWFDGNPTNIVPLAPQEEAERLAQLAGGREQLLAAARKALASGDYRWAARLADCLINLNMDLEDGKNIKAEALLALSRQITPISGKNYLQQSALELLEKA